MVKGMPAGLCVGFIPHGGYHYITYTLTADDGGEFVYVVGKRVYILAMNFVGQGKFAQHPEPPLPIWRTEGEFKEWSKTNTPG